MWSSSILPAGLAIDEVMMTEVANIKAAVQATGDPICGGFHDGPGCSEYGQSLQRPARFQWCGTNKT